MFDEAQRKEIEVNPDGAKYPMAIFSFTDDGKIQKINFPNNMDKYNAESIIELINKVILKLTRNKKEDISNGLEITTKKLKNKRTIVQTEAPKELEKFKGSRYTKIVKTKIEDEQITNVESDDNLYMASKPEGEELTFGPKEFFYNAKSEITLNEVKYNEKENVELFNKLAEKFTLIDSEVLLKSFEKNKEEKTQEKEIETKEEKEETKQTRNLFFFSAYKVFPLVIFDIVGKKVSVRYEVGLSNFKAVNKLVISSPLGNFDFGMSSGSENEKGSKRYSQPIFVFPLPPLPFISIGCYVSGSLSFGVSLYSGSGLDSKYKLDLGGSLSLGAEIKAGWDPIFSVSVFAEGTIAEAEGSVILSNGSGIQGNGFKLSAGKVVVGARFKELGIFEQSWSTTLFNGWTLVNI